MPTGFEEAGLALAIFPLLVSVIEQYRQGLDIIKSWIRYKKSLRSLLRILQGEKLLFLNVCYKLVDTICQDHGRTADALFKDLLSPTWATPALQVKIHNALGPEQWHCIQGVIAEIKDVLVQLLDEVRRSVTIDTSSPLFERLQVISSRVRILSPRKRAELDDLHRNIDTLQKLVQGMRVDKNELQSTCDPELYRRTRERVHTLCEALQQSFVCPAVHTAVICLGDQTQVQRLFEESAGACTDDEVLRISFQLHLKEWRTAAFTHHDDLQNHTCCGPIQNLCACLQSSDQISQPKTAKCVGFIQIISNEKTHSEKTSSRERGHCISGAPISPARYCIGDVLSDQCQMLSLHDILSSQRRYSRFPLHFYERDRLKLAIIFASSLLTFHSTPWLAEMWTARDILFRPVAGDLDDISVVQPYVAQSFPSSRITTRANPPPMVRNPSLYALAKVLIQLIENRPLSPDARAGQAASTDDPELKAAIDLEPSMCRKAGRVGRIRFVAACTAISISTPLQLRLITMNSSARSSHILSIHFAKLYTVLDHQSEHVNYPSTGSANVLFGVSWEYKLRNVQF